MPGTVTTAVTNFSRIDRLRECIQSLDLSQPLTLASYGVTPEHSTIALPDRTPVFRTSSDHGCNLLWMQAVAMARTKWVSILHDDDRRPPGYAQEMARLADACQSKGYGFAAWHGRQLDCLTGQVGHVIQCGSNRAGTFPSEILLPALRQHNGLAMSPVGFLYDRETVLDTLDWCQRNLADCVTRPGMMVGNDLALTIAHVRRSYQFIQSGVPLSLYGHWDGSETIRWSQGLNPRLTECYNLARSRLFPDVVIPRRRQRLFIHVTISGRGPLGRRQRVAQPTWMPAFEALYPDYIPVPVHLCEADLPRDSGVLGDPRRIAFIRDLIEAGRRMGHPHDVIALSNDDVCVTPDCFRTIADHAVRYGAAATHRRDFYTPFDSPKSKEEIIRTGHWHAGGDLFAFTGEWWDGVGRPSFPDFVIACEAWDWIFRWIVKYSTGRNGFKNLCYHEYHGGWWEHPGNRFSNPSQLHNRRLARAWMLAHGSYKGEFDGRNLPTELNVEPEGEDDP